MVLFGFGWLVRIGGGGWVTRFWFWFENTKFLCPVIKQKISIDLQSSNLHKLQIDRNIFFKY